MNINLPKESKVLLWSNDGYYLEKEYLYALDFITRMADGKNLFDSQTTLKELKRFGITHVAMTDNYLRKPLYDVLENIGSLEILYKDKYMEIGALP